MDTFTSPSGPVSTKLKVDVVIAGGGIAGLWALARCLSAGYNTILIETNALGAGQTRYAQGIIHGGTKYALTGKLTASSEAVADMPSRWRACYQGQGDVDLSAATLLSESHYLWSTNTLVSRLSGFFASKVMRNRSTELGDEGLPSLFSQPSFKGQVYRLDEPVFDTLSVIRALAEPRSSNILMFDGQSFGLEGQSLWLTADNGNRYQLDFNTLVLMAGEGNEQLLAAAGQGAPVMQRRPLKMVAMQGGLDSPLEDRVYAHCLGASVNPRITITSHFNSDGGIVWYMGGQPAEEGVHKTDAQLIADIRKELAELIPWLDLAGKKFSVLPVDRAEIKKPGTTRPDSYSIEAIDQGFVAWPTKLALAPALADELLDRLQAAGTAKTSAKIPAFPPVRYADFPWNSCDWTEQE